MGNSTFFTSPKQLKISTMCSFVTFRVRRPMWMRSARGVASRRFLPASVCRGVPSLDRPLFSLFLSTDARLLSSFSALPLRGLRSRDRDLPRKSSLFLFDDFSLFRPLLPGDTDLRFVRERSLELDDEDEDDDEELDELDPELLRDEELDELKKEGE